MHTPPGFEPAHHLPPVIPDDAHAFAFRGDKVLAFAREDETFTLPSHGQLVGAGLRGVPHFLGLLEHDRLRGAQPAGRCARAAGMRYVGLRTLFFKVPEPLLALAARAFQVVEWDRTPSLLRRAAARRRATRAASARRNARPAGSSRTRACRRR